MSAPVRPGDLRLRVILQQRSSTPDGVGGQTDVWTNVWTVWAALAELSTGEKLASQQEESAVTHKMYLRYIARLADPKVVAALRVLLVKDGVQRIFNIHGSHDDDERRRFLVLDVEEGINNG